MTFKHTETEVGERPECQSKRQTDRPRKRQIKTEKLENRKIMWLEGQNTGVYARREGERDRETNKVREEEMQTTRHKDNDRGR